MKIIRARFLGLQRLPTHPTNRPVTPVYKVLVGPLSQSGT